MIPPNEYGDGLGATRSLRARFRSRCSFQVVVRCAGTLLRAREHGRIGQVRSAMPPGRSCPAASPASSQRYGVWPGCGEMCVPCLPARSPAIQRARRRQLFGSQGMSKGLFECPLSSTCTSGCKVRTGRACASPPWALGPMTNAVRITFLALSSSESVADERCPQPAASVHAVFPRVWLRGQHGRHGCRGTAAEFVKQWRAAHKVCCLQCAVRGGGGAGPGPKGLGRLRALASWCA